MHDVRYNYESLCVYWSMDRTWSNPPSQLNSIQAGFVWDAFRMTPFKSWNSIVCKQTVAILYICHILQHKSSSWRNQPWVMVYRIPWQQCARHLHMKRGHHGPCFCRRTGWGVWPPWFGRSVIRYQCFHYSICALTVSTIPSIRFNATYVS